MSKEKFIDLVTLTKPRIVILALMMASLGYFLGQPGYFSWFTFLSMLVGTALVGMAACTFNQHAEIDLDKKMKRTQNRPLPSGRVDPLIAIQLGWVSAILGEIILGLFVNPTTAILGAITLFSYVALYTPSKLLNPFSTLIGAIPGAIPPLMGWAAARDSISGFGLVLFGILFLWQIPHFLAIGWIYREDYSKASVPILTAVDNTGFFTAKQSVLYTLALLPLTLVPTLWGISGVYYFAGALLLGSLFFISTLYLSIEKNIKAARWLFFISILYLPLLGGLMLWDKLPR